MPIADFRQPLEGAPVPVPVGGTGGSEGAARRRFLLLLIL